MGKYHERLARTTARISAKYTSDVGLKKTPKYKPSVFANIISALTGRKVSRQEVARITPKTAWGKHLEYTAPSAVVPGYRKLDDDYTLADARAGRATKWRDDGVRFMKPGEIWDDDVEVMQDLGKWFDDYEEIKNYINARPHLKHLLVAVEVWNEDIGDYIYELWLMYER